MSSPQVSAAPPPGMPNMLAQRREEARRLKESAAARRSAAASPSSESASPAPATSTAPASADPRALRRVHSATPVRNSPASPASAAPHETEAPTLSRPATFAARPAAPHEARKLQPSPSFDVRRSAALRGFSPAPRSPVELEKLREQARALRGLPPAAAARSPPTSSTPTAAGKPEPAASSPVQTIPTPSPSPPGASVSCPTTVRGRVSSTLNGIAERMKRRAQLRVNGSSSPSTAKLAGKQAPTAPSPPRHAVSPSTKEQRPRPTAGAHQQTSRNSPFNNTGPAFGGPSSRLRTNLGLNVPEPGKAGSLGRVERLNTGATSAGYPFTSSPSGSGRLQSGVGTPGSTSSAFVSPNMAKVQQAMRTPPGSPMRTPPATPCRPPSPAMEQPSKMSRVRSFDSSKASGSPAAFTRVNSSSVPSPRTPDACGPPRSARVSSPETTPASCKVPPKAFAPWEAGDSVHAIRTASKKLTKENFMVYVYTHHPLKDPNKTLNAQLPVKKQMQKALSHYHPDKQNLSEDGPEWCLICEEICKEITRMYKKRETPAK